MQPTVHRGHEVEAGVILRFVAAAALLGAAAVNFALMGEQAGVSGGRGAFFAVVAWIEIGLALTMVRPSRASMVAVVALNVRDRRGVDRERHHRCRHRGRRRP